MGMQLCGDPDAVMVLLVNEIQLRVFLDSSKYWLVGFRLVLKYLVSCCTHLSSTSQEVKENVFP